MSKILVIGGAGFIGSHLVDNLVSLGHGVTVFDNLSTGKKENLINSKKGIALIQGDVNKREDIEQVFKEDHFDYVYHYAAVVGVKRTLANPFAVFDDLKGITNVLELCVEYRVKRILYSSSSEVYGEPVEVPLKETSPLNARLPYALVKSMGEAMIKAYNKKFGLSYTIFRFFNTYGPRQSEDFVVSKFIKAGINDRNITIYGDGLQTRSFFYIDDNVRVTTGAMKLADNYILNVGSCNEITIKDLAKTIHTATDSDGQVQHIAPLTEGDMTRRCPSTDLMDELFPFDKVTLEDGLVNTVRYERSRWLKDQSK